MGLIKLALIGGAGYYIGKRVSEKNESNNEWGCGKWKRNHEWGQRRRGDQSQFPPQGPWPEKNQPQTTTRDLNDSSEVRGIDEKASFPVNEQVYAYPQQYSQHQHQHQQQHPHSYPAGYAYGPSDNQDPADRKPSTKAQPARTPSPVKFDESGVVYAPPAYATFGGDQHHQQQQQRRPLTPQERFHPVQESTIGQQQRLRLEDAPRSRPTSSSPPPPQQQQQMQQFPQYQNAEFAEPKRGAFEKFMWK